MAKFILVFISFLLLNQINGQDISVITQQKNNGTIQVLSYSPDGNLLATGGKGDHTIKVWDIKSGKIIGTLQGHDKALVSLEFDKTGEKLISAGADKRIILWNILDWTLIDSTTMIAEPNCITKVDNDMFFSGLDNGMVYQFNLATFNNPKMVFSSSVAVNHIRQFGDQLAIAKKGGILVVYDYQKKVKIVEKKIHPISIIGFDYIPESKHFISAGSEGKIVLWDVTNLSQSKQIKTNSLIISSFDSNPAHSIFAISTGNKTIKIFKHSGDLLYEFKGSGKDNDTPIKAIRIAPNGNTIASSGTRYTESLKGRKATAIIKLWDIKRGIIYKTLKGEVNPTFAFDFHPQKNKLVILGGDRILTFWDLNIAEKYGDFTLPKPKREIPPRAKTLNLKKGAKLLDKALKVASGNIEAALGKNEAKSIAGTVLKRNTIEKDHISFSSTGKYLITKLKHDEIRLYNFENRRPEPAGTVFSYQPVINKFETSPNDEYMAVIGSGDSAVSIIDLKTKLFVTKLSTPSPSVQRLKFVYEAQSMAFSPDGQYLAVCFNTSKTFVWRVKDWQLVFENILPGNIGYAHGTYVNFTENGEHLIINTFSGIKKYDTKTFDVFSEGFLKIKGHSLPVNKPCNYAATIKDGYLYFENLIDSKTVKSIPLKPEMVSQVSTKSNGKIGVTLINGQFFILNPENGEDEIMLVSNGDNSIIKTHENYYKVTKEGFDLVTFRIGNKAFPFEQFDAVYNRPDLVLKKLNCQDEQLIKLYHKAYEKRIKKLGLSTVSGLNLSSVPVTEIINPQLIPAVAGEPTLDLNLKFKDQTALLSYNIWVNNVPLHGKKGKSLGLKKNYETKAKIALVNGINKIQVACRNKSGYESLFETIYVRYKAENDKQNVYLVAIGTSKYKDANYNLNYAAKDAGDLTSLLNSNANQYYQNIKVKTLLDEEVTIESVAAVKSFISEAKINDIVIVFVAGHGVLDENFDYYFATHPMDFSNPKLKGLPYEKLEGLLDGITARRKILIMDTCHSGEVDKDEIFFSEEETDSEEEISFRSAGQSVGLKEENASPGKMMNELFTDLRRGTGATVLSSAGGAEYALESDEWKNGLFSYCLLTGIKNNLADLDKDGEIQLSELQTYVVEKVKALSRGKQIPNSRIQNIELDFRIW